MDYETSISIAATGQRVWDNLIHVDSWPDWINTYEAVHRLDGGALRVGSRVRIKETGLRAAIWTVTSLEVGQSFVWESHFPGVHNVGRHTIVEDAVPGVTHLILHFNQYGPLSFVVGRFLGAKIRGYVDDEAAGLRAASETPTSSG